MSKKARYTLIILFIAILLPFIMLINTGTKSITVVDKGELLPYVKGYTIYKIRVFDKYEFYVEPENKPTKDTVNTYVLVGIAFISLTILSVMRALKVAFSDKRLLLFLFMCIGANYLAIDEFFGIHETLGHNMQFLTLLAPFVKRPDDVIILSYSIPVFLFLYFFHKHLIVSKTAVIMFIAAPLFYILGAVSDVFALPIEEISETLSSVFIITGVLSLGIHYIKKTVAVTQ